VSPATLVLGKLLAALLLLAPMLLAALFVPAVLAARAGDGLAPVGLLALAYGLYLGSFAALGVAISARARDPGGALVNALGLWIAMVIVVPRLAADFTAWSSSTPSEHEFSAQVAREIKEGINGHDPRDKRTEALKAVVLAEYGVKTIEELPINFAGVALQAGEEYSDQVHDRHHAQLHTIYREQADEALRFAVLSPRVALQPLSAALCGTDLAAHLEFAAAAEAHRRTLVRLLNDDVTRHPGVAPFDYLAGPELWRRVAELRWEPGLRPAGRASPRHLIILAGFFAASVALVLVSARRLRVDP
jgi:ABC-2 type transport system permease protein